MKDESITKTRKMKPSETRYRRGKMEKIGKREDMTETRDSAGYGQQRERNAKPAVGTTYDSFERKCPALLSTNTIRKERLKRWHKVSPQAPYNGGRDGLVRQWKRKREEERKQGDEKKNSEPREERERWSDRQRDSRSRGETEQERGREKGTERQGITERHYKQTWRQRFS